MQKSKLYVLWLMTENISKYNHCELIYIFILFIVNVYSKIGCKAVFDLKKFNHKFTVTSYNLIYHTK